MTQKLYDIDAYLSGFDAHVISCTSTEGGFETVLNKTAFFPNEGGQDCDTGTLGDARVTYVFLRADEIIHITDKPVSGDVHGTIDFAARFDRMQQHTAEHIVCGLAHRKYGYENVGFHLGERETTFDFDGPLTDLQLKELEELANAAVMQNLNVTCFYPDENELNALEYRSKKELSGSIRIVEIDSVDRCACCAPHVSSTGEIGLIKFTDSEAYKGGIRIHMLCGMRALRDFSAKQQSLEHIARRLSCTSENATEFFDKFCADTAQLRQTVSDLRKELVEQKAAAVQPTDGSILMFEPDMDGTARQRTLNALSGKYGKLCAVFSGDDKVGYSFAASGTLGYDMRRLADIMRRDFKARCGGNDRLIQGSITTSRAEIERLFSTAQNEMRQDL